MTDHAEVDHFHETDNLSYNAFAFGACFNGFYDHIVTTRFRTHVNQPVVSYVHQAVGASFTPNSGGVVAWNDGRLNIRKVGPPTYMHNLTNVDTTLANEILMF